MQLKIYLEEQEEGGYTVFVPALSGCKEAIKNIKEAIELYMEEEPEGFNKGKIVNIEI